MFLVVFADPCESPVHKNAKEVLSVFSILLSWKCTLNFTEQW